ALFEGVSRRLERPVEAPSADQVSGAKPVQSVPAAQRTHDLEPLTLTQTVRQPIPLSEVII
ncbi:MAG TPA: hypothetical protein VE224_11885, partial [Pseudolabrys sp.]|nr:hypothetical protein [Pseudolabrys sp.]